MTAPCFYCGSARSCDHRIVDPPLQPETKPGQNRQTDARRYNFSRGLIGKGKWK